MEKVFVFDFDGTLTRRDTLIEFMRHVKGTKAVALALLRHLPMLLMMKAGLFHNGKAKRILFSYIFAGMREERFNAYCHQFAQANKKLLRKKGMEKVAAEAQAGNRVIILSASIENWVKPFFADCAQGNIQVIGTRVAVEDGRLTGHFSTKNCYGAEKVRRLKEALPDRRNCHITAFGDSRGDIEMLDFSDEGYYKPFRK